MNQSLGEKSAAGDPARGLPAAAGQALSPTHGYASAAYGHKYAPAAVQVSVNAGQMNPRPTGGAAGFAQRATQPAQSWQGQYHHSQSQSQQQQQHHHPQQSAAASGAGTGAAGGYGHANEGHGDMWLFNVLEGGSGAFDDSMSVLHPGDAQGESAPPRIVFEGDARNEPSSVAYRLLGRTLEQADVSRLNHGVAADAMFAGLAHELQDSALDGHEAHEAHEGNTTSDSYGGPSTKGVRGSPQGDENNSYDEGVDDVKDEDEDALGADGGGASKSDSRKKSVDINRRYRRKVQNSIYELQTHLELRNLCPQNRRLSRAEAANRSLAYIRALEQKVDRMRRACNLAFILQNMELTRSYLEDLYVMCNWDERKMLPIVMQDLLHVFDFAIAEMWKVDYDARGAEVLTYAFGVRKSCISSDSESLLNMFEISSERMKFAAMQGLPGRAFSMRQSQFLPSASDGAQFLRSKQAEKAGLTSGYAFPIMQGTVVHYVSVFLSTEKRDFNYILFNAVQSLFTILSSIHFSKGLQPTARSDLKSE
ncbi:hypothetical protein FVE85_8112 [Porphyridium purpureum]|uniref:BHLH domain-containing protein n=1 Tax=Porphyridium purpureum TaxID=35688 RepID=A0A5J4YN58_PORPP|nr:hypothetical protein FVE85_8112 [Porphyridium purpureum]|eukprot:POR9546..scf295_9